MRVATSETGAAWNEFEADLVARGLSGVRLVTSDAHQGLVEAVTADCPAHRGNDAEHATPPT